MFITSEMIRQKIISFDKLHEIRENYKDKKIVLCHGTYDILHPGHILHFEEAKKKGDILVVTITADEFILKKKKTFFNKDLRAKQVASVEIVDFVSIIYESTALTPIGLLKPDFYVKGKEFKDLTQDPTSNIIHEKELVEKNGGQIFFTNGQTFSSTKIGYFLGITSEAEQNQPFIKRIIPKFKDISEEKFDLNTVNSFLKKISQLKVCVIGETIVDECKYIRLRSISQKSKCISGEEQKELKQIGGAGAVALHVANFVKQVDLYTNDMDVDFNKNNLNVVPLTEGKIIKTRFVDFETNNVIYEHKILDNLNSEISLIREIGKYDVVLTADFGHGLITASQAQKLSMMNKNFFAVNVQSNSSNFGFNILDKYPFADYFSMNKLEAELLLRKNFSDKEQLVKQVSETIKAKQFAVTLSSEGAVLKNFENSYYLPSLSLTTVDTVGCGDAFFSFSSLALALDFSPRYALLFGNVGSGIMTQKIMNESPVTFQEFLTVCKIVI